MSLIQLKDGTSAKDRMQPRSRPVVGWISLGCPKNLVDSEGMLGALQDAGCDFTPDVDQADAVVVNTCGFVEDAREESVAALRESIGYNRKGERRRVIAVGCMAQRVGEELLELVPGLDAVVGMGQQESLPEVLQRTLNPQGPGGAEAVRVFDPAHYFPPAERRLRLTPSWMAYVKISDGCDNPCTFCSIPLMRGALRSRPPEEIEREVMMLADQGVQEISLIAQDSTHYGADRRRADKVPEDIAGLLQRLARIDGPRWIRLMYAYPTRVNDRLLDVMAGEPRICKYIDMPLQHASDPVLAAMKRPGTAASYLRLIEQIRLRVPGITLRTTMILGFPGESDQDFKNLMQFVEEAQFDRLGAFRYSPEPGTPGSLLPNASSKEQVDERYDRLMSLQQRISLARNRERMGSTVLALVERVAPNGMRVGRTEGDAPEIDGTILIRGTRAVPGEFLEVTVTGAEPYDLHGRAQERRPIGAGSNSKQSKRIGNRAR